MTDYCFDFLKLRPFSAKPRSSGLFIGTDQGMPLGQQKDLLESHADVIDYAKFADHAGLASRYSEQWLRKKLTLYRQYKVGTFIGGITYELAVLQGKVHEYFDKIQKLGFTGVEISEDAIPPMPAESRAAAIREAASLGLQVFTEVGRKFPDKPLSAREAIADIKRDLALGSHSVTIEAAETAILKDKDPQVIVEIVNAIGLEKLIFECTPPEPWHNVGMWLIRTFGSGVNLENVMLQDCARVYVYRQGMTRDNGYFFMTEMGAKP